MTKMDLYSFAKETKHKLILIVGFYFHYTKIGKTYSLFLKQKYFHNYELQLSAIVNCQSTLKPVQLESDHSNLCATGQKDSVDNQGR